MLMTMLTFVLLCCCFTVCFAECNVKSFESVCYDDEHHKYTPESGVSVNFTIKEIDRETSCENRNGSCFKRLCSNPNNASLSVTARFRPPDGVKTVIVTIVRGDSTYVRHSPDYSCEEVFTQEIKQEIFATEMRKVANIRNAANETFECGNDGLEEGKLYQVYYGINEYKWPQTTSNGTRIYLSLVGGSKGTNILDCRTVIAVKD